MLQWVWPVLAGIPAGRWMSYEIEPQDGSPPTVQLRCGTDSRGDRYVQPVGAAEAAELDILIPGSSPLVLILLDDHVEQIMSLLDSNVTWLNSFDTHDPAVRPLLSLCERFQVSCPIRRKNQPLLIRTQPA